MVDKKPHEKTERNPKGAGSPEIIIDWEKVNSMCKIQCTGEEMASVLDVDYDTLNSACKREHDIKFSDYIALKAPAGKASLRRRQYLVAMDGNPTMLVWVGKNWLGQTDRSPGEENQTVINNIILPDDKIEEVLKKLMGKDDC